MIVRIGLIMVFVFCCWTGVCQESPRLYVVFEDGRAMNDTILTELGVESIPLIHGSFFPKELDQPVNYSLLKDKILEIFPDEESNAYAVLDWEGEWFNVLSQNNSKQLAKEVFSDVINEYVKVISFINEFRPNLKLAYYGIPFRSFNFNKRTLLKRNFNISDLIEIQDFLAPSLYFYNNTHESQLFYSNKTYMANNISVFNQINERWEKPLYVFIWHRWHPNSKNDPLDLIPVNLFSELISALLSCNNTTANINSVLWYVADYNIAQFNRNNLYNRSKVERFSYPHVDFKKERHMINPMAYQQDVFLYYISHLSTLGLK